MSKYHCWPFAVFVLGRTRRADDRGVNDGALRDLDAAALQMVIDRRQQRLAELLETRQRLLFHHDLGTVEQSCLSGRGKSVFP